MEEEDNNIKLNKAAKPAVSEDFFQKFQDSILKKIELKNSELDLIKTKKPKVPADFFETFQTKLSTQIEAQKIKPLFPKRLVYWGGSIAAILIIGLLVFPFLNQLSEEPAEFAETMIESSNEEGEMDAYLAIIDEETLMDYYIEEDISIEDESTSEQDNDALMDFIGEDFEDIYISL